MLHRFKATKMPKVDLQAMFVAELERLMSNLDEIDNAIPNEYTPKWWWSMAEIRKSAFDAVQKFKIDKNKTNEDQHK